MALLSSYASKLNYCQKRLEKPDFRQKACLQFLRVMRATQKTIGSRPGRVFDTLERFLRLVSVLIADFNVFRPYISGP